MNIRHIGKSMLLALVCVAVAAPLSGCKSLSSVLSSVSSSSSTLTTTEISSALKEALKIGITNGISTLSATNGFYNDATAKISLPSEASVITKNISYLPGGSDLVETVVKNINAAASDAAGNSVAIFTSAITSMSITDAKTILTSGGTAATDYFKSKCRTKLKTLFASYIDESLDKKLVGSVSASSSWSTLTSKWNTVATSTVGKAAGLSSVNTDLSDYLTEQAVDAIFVKVGEAETNIRTNVSARTTTLLKKVFAQQ